MAQDENLEQKIRLTYETNADEVGKEVGALADTMDDVTTAEEKNKKATEELAKVQKSFKAQLREANEDLRKVIQRYGETSTEAVKAAQKVADLKDEMQFAKDLVDNFDPDQKFKALGAATQIAATGTSAVVSGLALIGGEGEDTQKILLKVQAAMAFADSVKGLSSLGDQWKVFKTVVIDTFKSIVVSKTRDIAVTEAQTVAEAEKNAVMLANPYVLAAAAIAAITIATVAWVKSNNDAAKEQERVSNAVKYNISKTDTLKMSIEQLRKETEQANNTEVLRARAYGATDEEIQKLIESQKKLARQTAFDAENTTYNNYLKAQENLGAAIKNGDDDLVKEAEDASKKAYDLWRSAAEQKNTAIVDEVNFELDTRIEANKKREQAEKDAAAKLKALRDKARQLKEEADKKAADREMELFLQREDRKVRILEEIEAAKQALADRVNGEEQAAIDAENKRYEEQLARAEEFCLSTEELELEHLNKLNDIRMQKAEEDRANHQAVEDAKLAYDQELTQAKLDLAEKAAGFLTAIAGKSKIVQKAAILAESGVGIAKMIISNQQANIGALATPQAIATSGASAAPVIALNNVTTGLGVGTALAATAKALSAVGGGGSASQAGSNPGGGAQGGAAASAAPQVQFQASSESQIGEAAGRRAGESGAYRTYVVASEITAQQEVEEQAAAENSISGGG